MISAKPLIGVPGRRKVGSQVEGFSGPLAPLEMDVYLADYSRGVLEAGGLPVNIPLDADPADYLPHLNGVLLTGGADVDPSSYGQDADGNGGYEQERDRLEFGLLEAALADDVPVLGICRGMQLLNIHVGGSLNQHVPPHSRYDVATDQTVHEVSFEPGSELHRLYGDRAAVNSLHHQTIDTLGEGLAITATADDGTIEGVELTGRPVIAVQWHPEMLSVSDPVFTWLITQTR